jgi:hypothetical protein
MRDFLGPNDLFWDYKFAAVVAVFTFTFTCRRLQAMFLRTQCLPLDQA